MTEHTPLREAFASPESRSDRTTVVVDIINSTDKKWRESQASWLNSLGWFYDTVTEIMLQAFPDAVVKYLGDGMMWVFPTDRTTEAVNGAIRVQEVISEASAGRGSGKGVIDFSCSIGISTGEVIGFRSRSGGADFVGLLVDKAFRLCSAANAKAIWVDTATLGAANTMRIRSVVGAALNRSSDEYLGEVQKAPLKGFEQPVAYHELLWGQQLYGVKNSTVTASTDRLREAPGRRPQSSRPASPVERPQQGRNEGRAPDGNCAKQVRYVGKVICWRPENNYGFVRDEQSGEEFHFTSSLIVYPEDIGKLTVGTDVVFAAKGEKSENRRRQAAAILVVGEPAEGRLAALPAGRNYGWIKVEDGQGNAQLVFASTTELGSRKVGDELEFIVRANARGSYAEEIDEAVDQAA